MKWLHSKRDEAVQSIFWSLLFAIAMLIDYSGFLREGSDNPLDLPDFVGPKGKAMTNSTSKKTKVAKLAAAGDIFKS